MAPSMSPRCSRRTASLTRCGATLSSSLSPQSVSPVSVQCPRLAAARWPSNRVPASAAIKPSTAARAAESLAAGACGSSPSGLLWFCKSSTSSTSISTHLHILMCTGLASHFDTHMRWLRSVKNELGVALVQCAIGTSTFARQPTSQPARFTCTRSNVTKLVSGRTPRVVREESNQARL
jgi:hypothetical protein